MTDAALSSRHAYGLDPVELDRDYDALLEGVAPERAERLRRFLRERDALAVLHEALLLADQAASLEQRLEIYAQAIRRIGFGRVAITLRDAALEPTLVVTAGLSPEEAQELRTRPAGGAVWRRRFAEMGRFRISESYYLDGRDPWVSAEFRNNLPSELLPGDDPDWSPSDMLIVPLPGSDGNVLATLVLDDPADRRRPTLDRVRTVELVGRQMANSIERAGLVDLAERRAERLQRLQEVGNALARSLDERAILGEIGRQLPRVVRADAVLVLVPDLEAGTFQSRLHLVQGMERAPIVDGRLADAGIVASAARLGRAVRVADCAAERGQLPADFLADGMQVGSAIAVPMITGTRLLGVVLVATLEPGAHGPEDEEALATVAAQAASALTNARLYAESQQEQRQSEALADVARAVSESLRLGEVLNLILRHALALLRAEGGAVALRRDDYLHTVAAVGGAKLLAGMHIPVNGSITGKAVTEGTYVIANDAWSHPSLYRPTARVLALRNTLIVPLITARGAIGALTVINRDADFTEEDARVLQRFADHVAVAIVNARLFEEVAEATQEWRVAFDAIPVGMLVLDEHARIARFNARALQIAGVRGVQTLLGRSFYDAVLGGVAPGALAENPVGAAMDEGITARATLHAPLRGRILDVLASPHPNGGAVVSFDDVTEVHALAARHRAVVETTNDAILITDTERRIAFANRAAHELFGYEELVGLPVDRTVAPEHAEVVRSRETAAFEGTPQRYEAMIVRADGERRIVSVSTAPLHEVGEVQGIVASLRDVTEERRARDAVAESEARYRNLFETALDAIYTLDARGVFTSANEATSRIVGIPVAEILGRTIEPLIASEDFPFVKEHFKAALSGEARRYECRAVGAAGPREVSVTNTPIRVGGRVVGVLGIARDVTDERARAEALARSEARYTRLVESASDAIFTLDEEGCFTSVNRALEQGTGRARDELLGRPFATVLAGPDHDSLWLLFAETLRGNRERGEFRYLDRAGALRTSSIITAPIVEGGRVVGILGVARDVTEEKLLMEQLIQQEKLAAIGQLVSGVAHELNNPLAGVLAFSQLLLASPALTGEQRAATETIHQEGKRAAKIVTNLLTFARQHPPERTLTDLNQVVQDTLELRRYAMQLEHVEISTDLDDALPTTWADPFQLQQVMLNLIGNAEHAVVAQEGPRRIHVATRRVGEALRVSITDSGVGIAPEHMDRIFNPFFTTKPVGQGTGLGLSISDGIVREHGGRMRVESEPGRGTTFHVEIPLADPPDLFDTTPPAAD